MIGRLQTSGKIRYNNVPAAAMTDIGRQLARANQDELAVPTLRGVLRGLTEEAGEEFPVCPFCGRRHAPHPAALLARVKKQKAAERQLLAASA